MGIEEKIQQIYDKVCEINSRLSRIEGIVGVPPPPPQTPITILPDVIMKILTDQLMSEKSNDNVTKKCRKYLIQAAGKKDPLKEFRPVYSPGENKEVPYNAAHTFLKDVDFPPDAPEKK
jgi:hypothetical protein